VQVEKNIITQSSEYGGIIMANSIDDTSQGKAVKVAGIAFLLSLIIPILSSVFVFSKLIVPGNPAVTVGNIMAHELLFRIGIISDLIISMNVLVLSVALYVILKRVNRNLALLALSWRLVEAVLVGVATLGSLIALLLLNGTAYAEVFGAEHLQALAGIFIDSRDLVFSIIFTFLGLGSVIFCYLFFRSKYIPGILAAFGIFSYLLLLLYSFVTVLFPGYVAVAQIVCFPPSCLFEAVIGPWLLSKGINVRHEALK
jgi:hypothetical protein